MDEIEKDIGNKKSLLKKNKIWLSNRFYIRIPSVGEILDNEENYYSILSTLCATPMDFMVQLDDMGIHNYSDISEYELFKIIFPNFIKNKNYDFSVIFGDIDLSDIDYYSINKDDNEIFLYSPSNDIVINPIIYLDMMKNLRNINLLQKHTGKPGNEDARKYLLEKERKKLKRLKHKKYEPYLESMIISLVNTSEFKYNYETVMDLSIYKFNQSVQQIQHKIDYDNTMHGAYAGTVDLSKIKDKKILSWIKI